MSNFTEAMDRSVADIRRTVSRSLHDAGSSHGGEPGRGLAMIGGQEPIFKGNQELDDLGNGRHCLRIRGVDAPAQARIIMSLLESVGATDVHRPIVYDSLTDKKTGRNVDFTIAPGTEDEVAQNFAGLANALSDQLHTMTRIMSASLFLDENRGQGKGSKFLTLATPENGEIVFRSYIETNELRLANALATAGFEHKIADHRAQYPDMKPGEFRRSDGTYAKNGILFSAEPEQLESVLAVIREFGWHDNVPLPQSGSPGSSILIYEDDGVRGLNERKPKAIQ